MSISNAEWEAIKRANQYRCKMCRNQYDGALIEKAHLKAKSKGGTQYIPLCRNCHGIYDGGLATDSQLKSLGLTRSEYIRFLPKNAKKAVENALSGAESRSFNPFAFEPVKIPDLRHELHKGAELPQFEPIKGPDLRHELPKPMPLFSTRDTKPAKKPAKKSKPSSPFDLWR